MKNFDRFSSLENSVKNNKIVERFWSNVEKLSDEQDKEGCWIWKKSLSLGYGQFSIYGRNGSTEGAHRFSFVLAGGKLSKGLEVCHRCDNRKCVRPSHLFSGTHLENILDAKKKGRLNIPSKGKNGSLNNQAKLKEEDIPKILDLRKSMSQTEVGKIFNVSRSCISLIERGKKWKFLCLA